MVFEQTFEPSLLEQVAQLERRELAYRELCNEMLATLCVDFFAKPNSVSILNGKTVRRDQRKTDTN